MSGMSTTTIHQGESTSELNHKFSTSWEIKGLKYSQEKTIKTPLFSPIPDLDAEFYFEFTYTNVYNPIHDSFTAKYKLVLFWDSCIFHVQKSIKINLTVIIESEAGTVLKKCEKNSISFDDKNIILDIADDVTYLDYETWKFQQERNIIPSLEDHSLLKMKCNFTFYEHLSSQTDYFRGKHLFKSLKYFVDDFPCMYTFSHLGDIKFKIGDEFLPAHTFILGSRSPVFLKMFSGDFLESKTNIIPITDSTLEIFKFFLKFLYCGEIEDESLPVVKELYILADKYDVRILKRNCVDSLASSLSIENVCEILILAHNFNNDDLKREAKSFAVTSFNEISSKDDWKELVQSNPFIAYEVVLSFAPKSD